MTRSRLRLVTLCLPALAALACRVAAAQITAPSHNAIEPPAVVAPPSQAPSTQTLMPGDEVMWQIAGQPDMNKTATITDAGFVLVPIAGPVHVAGLSLSGGARAIESTLKAGQYLLDPHVSLYLLKSRVAVIGEVAKQGVFRIDPDATVLDLLADAGGATSQSSGNVTIIRRDSAGRVHSFAVDLRGLSHAGNDLDAAEMHLQGGDQVVVERAGTVYVNGQVNRPGLYTLQPGMTVLEAIAAAGGPTDKGSEGRVQIQRTESQGRSYETLPAKLTDRVLPGDVVVVKERLF